MTLDCEMTATGNWLFRWRSFLPIAVVVTAVAAMFPFPLPQHDAALSDLIEGAALSISFLGLLLRCTIVGHTPARTSGRNTVTQLADSLNTTGMYSIVRHPLYLANFLIGLGLSCYTLTWWFVGLYVLTFWLYYERIMLAEEAFLHAKFGGEFEAWATTTPAFVPSFRHYVPPALPFSLRNILKREYNTLLQIVVVSFLLEFFGDWFDTHRISVSPHWYGFLAAGTLIWLILRLLKRHTGILDVSGR